MNRTEKCCPKNSTVNFSIQTSSKQKGLKIYSSTLESLKRLSLNEIWTNKNESRREARFAGIAEQTVDRFFFGSRRPEMKKRILIPPEKMVKIFLEVNDHPTTLPLCLVVADSWRCVAPLKNGH